MTVRWDRLPEKARAKVSRPRRKAVPGRWRCEGVSGCGAVHHSLAAAERCADSHGGSRLAWLPGEPVEEKTPPDLQ